MLRTQSKKQIIIALVGLTATLGASNLHALEPDPPATPTNNIAPKMANPPDQTQDAYSPNAPQAPTAPDAPIAPVSAAPLANDAPPPPPTPEQTLEPAAPPEAVTPPTKPKRRWFWQRREN